MHEVGVLTYRRGQVAAGTWDDTHRVKVSVGGRTVSRACCPGRHRPGLLGMDGGLAGYGAGHAHAQSSWKAI